MMSQRVVAPLALGLIVAVSGCAHKTITVDGKIQPLAGDKVMAKLILKRDGSCKARVIPSKIELEQGHDGTVVWKVRDASGDCLNSGTRVELRFKPSKDVPDPLQVNPTACKVLSNASNRAEIKCDLGVYQTNKVYRYSVWLVSSGSEAEILDPELEIVQF